MLSKKFEKDIVEVLSKNNNADVILIELEEMFQEHNYEIIETVPSYHTNIGQKFGCVIQFKIFNLMFKIRITIDQTNEFKMSYQYKLYYFDIEIQRFERLENTTRYRPFLTSIP